MDEIKRLEEQMDALGLETRRITLDAESIRELESPAYRILLWKFDGEKSLRRIGNLFEEKTLYILKEPTGAVQYLFLLPEEEGRARRLMRVGPVLAETAEDILREVDEKTSLTKEQKSRLSDYYYSLPLIRETCFLERLLTLQMRYIFGGGPIQVNRVMDFFCKPVTHRSCLEEIRPDPKERLAERYVQKEKLLEAITRGDREAACGALAQLYTFQPKRRPGCRSGLRSLKNMLLSENTLYREAAYRASVHPMYIEEIFRDYAGRIEKAAFEKDLSGMAMDMIRRYCLLVQKHSLAEYSQIIRGAVNYIDCHFRENISLKDVAAAADVSGSYLSARFRRETGMSVTDYINKRRVMDARKYLAVTDMPVGTICEQVGISSGNYFSRMFRKFEKCTPKEYREMMQARY